MWSDQWNQGKKNCLNPRPSPPSSFWSLPVSKLVEQSQTGQWEGLGMKLKNNCLPSCPHSKTIWQPRNPLSFSLATRCFHCSTTYLAFNCFHHPWLKKATHKRSCLWVQFWWKVTPQSFASICSMFSNSHWSILWLLIFVCVVVHACVRVFVPVCVCVCRYQCGANILTH